ncbi:ABC transporter permease [Nocardia cyriacigeorgica]|uniref:ABC transporter permease n=1 Tax=Nocardia cyriacigeorgica TaxID=135487 RepID=UPI00189372EF|nr:ABC transporter permease [Nocardia cyriacigeorgica]MBF6088883.1 ABC transporter permease [Nocardia cyriacigeorgica]MBF6098326.1 ABC transporter permease [Nocardia cyriacigeorgica]MBF6398533.1 ABC transporter permease [Nocardia cyriacigeorgica]MBF6403953.1 ABC transporter permease [Nocardia cyriacigeorgica]
MSTAPRRAWLIVAQREIAVKLRDRNFLISTVITIVAIVASLAVSGFLTSRTDKIEVAILDPAAGQVISTADIIADHADAGVDFTAHRVADEAALEQQVRDGTVDAGLLTVPSGWRLVGDTSENDDVKTYITAAAQQIALEHNATAAGVTLEQLARGSAVSYDLLDEAAVDTGLATIVAFVFAFLFYLSSILFGMSIAQSVVEEKQNRIVEILASAIPVRQLLIGKVAGNTVLAFAQLTLFVVAGLIGLAATGRAGQVGQIAGAAGWFIVFFVVGFLALAGLWAVAGSLATRSEDLQSTATPMTMFVMIVLFAGIFLSGTARVVASYVPIVSIVAMPARLAEGTAAWWEPIVALALMAVATYGIVIVAEKVYRRSLMQTQRRLTFRQALAVED